MKPDTLIIFIKNPILGQVKTRIEKASNPEKALSVYHELILITQQFVLDLPYSKYLYYSNFMDLSDSWSNDLFYKMKQVDGNLGVRMQQAFKEQESRSDKMILIGSDCPYLTKEILHEAFKSLEEHDVVLGPTQDGGYYLIGMKNYIQKYLKINLGVLQCYIPKHS